MQHEEATVSVLSGSAALVAADESLHWAINPRGQRMGLSDRWLSADIRSVCVPLSLTPGRRSDLSGVRFCQQLRLKQNYRGGLLLLGFRARAALARNLPLLAEQVSGTSYLQLPQSAPTIRQAIDQAACQLDESAFRGVVLGCCFEVEGLIHDLTGHLRNGQLPVAQNLLQDLVQMCANYHPLQQAVALAVSLWPNHDGVLDALQGLQGLVASLKGYQHQILSEVVDIPDSPPAECGAVLIGDNDLYNTHGLEQLGYSVRHVQTPDEVRELLDANPPDVFLCDLNFPDEDTGNSLMAEARQLSEIRLVIAISGSILSPETAPHAHGIVSGARDKGDARRIHQTIWRLSRQQKE